MIGLLTLLTCSISSIKLVCHFRVLLLGVILCNNALGFFCRGTGHEPTCLALWGYMDPYIMTSKQYHCPLGNRLVLNSLHYCGFFLLFNC
jgi:hypothetical protein